MFQRNRVVLLGQSRVVLVIETDGETVSDEPASSSRLRKAHPLDERAPTEPEFLELARWTADAVRSRRVG